MINLDPDDIKIALGEYGDIWPACIQADVILADIEHAEAVAARLTFHGSSP
jgi:hypothetical protein